MSSTVKAVNFQNPSASTPAIVTDTAGTATAYLSSINGQAFARNRIINGGMWIDQRNAGASQTFTAGAALAYCVDRWYGYCTGANVTGQRVAGTGTTRYYYRFTGASSVTAIGFGQRIETANCHDLNGTTVTLAVDLANSLLGTVTWTAYYANTEDTFGTLASPTRTQIATGSWSVNSTVTRYSTNITIPQAAVTGIEIVFAVGAQTSGTWTIGNVQLEPGSVATPFERRSYGMELGLCQRYYEKSYNQSLVPGTNVGVNTGEWTNVALNATDYYNLGKVEFRVTKRTSPSANIWSTDGTPSTARQQDAANVGVAIQMLSENGIRISSSGTTFTANNYHRVHWAASAEL